MFDDQIDAILAGLKSEKAKQAIENGHLDFPNSKILFDDWNTIPFGLPSECKQKLIVFVLEKQDIFEVIGRALLHSGLTCAGVTKLILFHISINKNKWNKIWSLLYPSFKKIEDERGVKVEIKFSDDELDFEMCPFCNRRKVTTYKETHDTWTMTTKKTPSCKKCASEVQNYMT